MKKQIISLCMILSLGILILAGCSSNTNTINSVEDQVPVVDNLKYEGSMDLKYAKNFTVDYFEGEYALISISNNTRFLVVPENMKVPENLEEDIDIIQQPISNVYLLATAAMSFFDELDALSAIRLSGTRAEGWGVENVVKAMESGEILFSGKYSEPDYELIMEENAKLSIQSNMITHSPEIKDKLEEIGLTVLVEQSSYETHALGRTEWIKLYSVLLDKEELGEKKFSEQASVVDELNDIENTGKTIAFFYVNSSGNIVARNSNDYVSAMIEMAGGKYIFENLGDPTKATSTTTIGMEQFYSTAKYADYIIYNSTIVGGMNSIDELLEKNELFANFKAVQDGNVWCTGQNFYQKPNEFGNVIRELRLILMEEEIKYPNLQHFYKLN